MNTILKPADDSDNSSSSSNNNSNNNRPSDAIEIKGHNNNQKINGRGRSNDSGLGDDEESPTDNYQQWKKLATIAKELHGQQADSIPHMLVEMKKQIPNAPARRARRHALSSFDQLNEAERERLGKINPLHKSTYETKDSQELVKEYVYTAMVSKERVIAFICKIGFDVSRCLRKSVGPDRQLCMKRKQVRGGTPSHPTSVTGRARHQTLTRYKDERLGTSHVEPMMPISSFNLTVSPFLITSGTSSLRTRIHLACTRTLNHT